MLKKVGSFLLLSHKGSTGRYWEIDALRGVAIVMMVTYHLAYDLVLLGYYQANVLVGLWRVFARVTATLFILLVGGSLALSHARIGRQVSRWNLYKNYLARGLKLLGWGIIISLVTWAYMGKLVIIFGILHLIGAATVLAFPFLSLSWANLVIGVAVIALGVRLEQVPVSHPWLLVLGLRPPTLYQMDYFPVLPWFGVALVGAFIGQYLYPGGTRRFDLPSLEGRPGVKELTWLGRRSLVIYLVHQPLLFGVFALANAIGIRNVFPS